MKVIIPLAGKGTRLRPHTHSKPKPLIKVAGKAVLGHILDSLKELKPEEIVFITGDMDNKIKDYVEKNYDFKTDYIKQDDLIGDGFAVNLAKENVTSGDVLIVFVDTIFKTDLSKIKDLKGDGICWVKETDTPERFGVVVLENDYITKIVEKPKEPVSNLAVIGLYYFKDSKVLFESLNEIIEQKRTSAGGEYRIADALALMIEKGNKFEALSADVWADCGKPETLLSTNRYLLEHGHSNDPHNGQSVFVKPVFIDKTAKIENSIIGPFVSIGAGCKITNSIILESIIDDNSIVENAALQNSLVGEGAVIKDTFRKLNVGDNSELNFGK
ncbi:MAG: NTP transferase domain-containing protein [bacterium]|nr:NTP transferase domain-containing protein [bacterium]